MREIILRRMAGRVMEVQNRIKLVIFDLDGTLVDAYQAVENSLNHVLAKLGYPLVDPGTAKRSVGWGERQLLSNFIRCEDMDRALRIYRRHHKHALKSATRSLPGAAAVLRFLRTRDCAIAIASNRPTETSRIIIRHLGWKDYFDAVLCADHVERPKPYPDLLLELLRRFGVKAGEAFYVGDMTIDAVAGRRAKVKTAIVLTGSSTRREVVREKPLWIIGRVEEIKGILRSELVRNNFAGRRSRIILSRTAPLGLINKKEST